MCVCVPLAPAQGREGSSGSGKWREHRDKTQCSKLRACVCTGDLAEAPRQRSPTEKPMQKCVGHKLMFEHLFLPSKPYRSLSWQQSLSGAFQQCCTHFQLLHDYTLFFFFFPLCN